MTDGQLLLAVFTGFYLVECLHWLPLGSVILSSWAGRGWVAQRPSADLSAKGSGLAMAWPLPPLGSFLVADNGPIIPDADGIWTTQAPVLRLQWHELTPRQEDQGVWLTRHTKLNCASRRSAQQLHNFLLEAQKLNPAKRKRLIDAWWQRTFSLPAARAAVKRYRLAASILRFPCLFVFALCFLWLPFLFWFYGESLRLLLGFVSLFLATALTAFTWRSLDRRLHPQEKRTRWPQVLHLLFMPSHAMRAHDLFGIEALAGFHPLTAASCLLPADALLAQAAQTWRRWRFMGPQDPLRPAADLVLPKLQTLCQRLGLSPAELESAPTRQTHAQSYCPCCHTQFLLPSAICKDCYGAETLAW